MTPYWATLTIVMMNSNVRVGENLLASSVSISSDGRLTVVVVDGLTDELKTHLRDYLVAVCRGAAAAEDTFAWDYRSTVRELHTRISAKTRNTKVGMVGELLTHVLAPFLVPRLTQISVFFNKEERNVKKGFDLTFLEEGTAAIWYCEVKSGESAVDQVAQKSAQLLRTAAGDLIGKLTSTDRGSLWDAAINDAILVLTNPRLKEAKHLLSADSSRAQKGEVWNRNAILTAGVFSRVADGRIDVQGVATALGPTEKLDERFADEVWLVVQKSTYEAVLEFIRAEALE